jgi:tRNA threonylcarbamoyl adenosine modification protein YeaZ
MTGGRVLAIDTSGTSALVALGDADGTLLTERRWPAGYRHGEELLTHVDEMLTASGTALADLGGIVVGTGPGAFTGLRVGLATAKALARGLNIPIAGVPSSEALLRAASLAGAFEVTRAVLLLPAGPSDRVVVAAGQVPAGEAPAGEAPAGEAPAGEAPAGEAPAGEAAAVAALPMDGPGVFEIAWGFARDREFETIREQIEAGTTVPSISEFFGAAFLYENEIRELFGINVTGIGVDLKGQLYKTSTRVPFSHAAVKARLAALAAAPVKPS